MDKKETTLLEFFTTLREGLDKALAESKRDIQLPHWWTKFISNRSHSNG